MNDKVIATNLTALRAKYGAAAMKRVKGRKVTDAADPAQNKAAIAATQAVAARIAKPKLPPATRSALEKMAKSIKVTASSILSFKITAPATRAPIAAAMRGGRGAKMAKLA
jgi:hypothetical protein